MKKYMSIYEKIRKDVEDGAYSFGQKIPSKRVMAEESGASLITVEHAYEILISEGYIESRERSGYFVSYSGDNDFSFSSYRNPQGGTVENFRDTALADATGVAGSCDDNGDKYPDRETERLLVNAKEEYFPFSVLASAVRSTLNDYGERLLSKTPNSGAPELKTAIKKYLARNALNADKFYFPASPQVKTAAGEDGTSYFAEVIVDQPEKLKAEKAS